MSEPRETAQPRQADFEAWEEKARADRQTQEERQATEIFLAALGLTPTFAKKVFLKGGILVGAVYESGRNTADLDFSTTMEPSRNFLAELEAELDAALPVATSKLGFPEKVMKLQSVKFRPREATFVDADAPALEVKFAYANIGSRQEARVHAGQSSQVIYADISFNEPIDTVERICINNTGLSFFAYSKCDLIAEKLRALLQQKIRNKSRRQDIYDLHYILKNYEVSKDERYEIANSFKVKCEARGIEAGPDSFDDPEIKTRARSGWDTLAAEVDELPDFEEAYDAVRKFYESLSRTP